MKKDLSTKWTLSESKESGSPGGSFAKRMQRLKKKSNPVKCGLEFTTAKVWNGFPCAIGAVPPMAPTCFDSS